MKSQVYQEERNFIFSRKGYCVRGVTVISALVESLIFSLAKTFLENHRVTYDPTPSQEFNQSLNILFANKILSKEEIENVKNFRTARNKSIHNIFKGMTRTEWNNQNRLVINLGRPIIEELEKKLKSKR